MRSERRKKVTLYIFISLFILCIFTLIGNYLTNSRTFDKRSNAAEQNITFVPKQIPLSDPEIINPGRGLYKWNGNEYVPSSTPSKDVYRRFLWRELENGIDQYDFSAIEQGAAEAKARGGKFWFGVYSLCSTACKYSDYAVPSYLTAKRSPVAGWWFHNVFIPDWNDEYFLMRSEKLMSALGQKYNNDSRIGLIDIRIYGNWGEWHTYFSGNGYDGSIPYPSPNGAQQITFNSLKRIVNMHVSAFSNKQLIILQGGSGVSDAVNYAMSLNATSSPPVKKPIGWRLDCWGDPDNLGNITGKPQWNTMKERWMTAPVTGEPCGTLTSESNLWPNLPQEVKDFHVSLLGNGNTGEWNTLNSNDKTYFTEAAKITGYRYTFNSISFPSTLISGSAFTVSSNWSNTGSAPTYDDWDAYMQLRNSSTNSVVWEDKMALDLKKLFTTGAASSQNDVFKLPATIPAGKYTLSLLIKDRQNYYKPMKLAVQNQLNDGTYLIGIVDVKNSPISTISSTPPIPTIGSHIPSGYEGKPYRGLYHPIPGVLEAEDFDEGDYKVAYYDSTPGNAMGVYRDTDVDIEQGGQNFNLGNVIAGEYLNYTINVKKAGTYKVNVLIASEGVGGNFHVDLNTVNKSGTISLPDTGNWQKFTTLDIPNITLEAGLNVISLVMDTNSPNGFIGNFDSITFEYITPTTSPIPSSTVTLTPKPSIACFYRQFGDANCNSYIELLDFNAFRDEYNLFLSGKLELSTATANFNNDASLDLLDFNIFREGYIAQNNNTLPTITPVF